MAAGGWDAIKAAIRQYRDYFRDQDDVIEVEVAIRESEQDGQSPGYL